jgi:hypothetical protein
MHTNDERSNPAPNHPNHPNHRGFHPRALKWLRDEMQLSTPLVPSDRGIDPTEPTRVPGFFTRPSRASAYAFTGLWVLSIGLVLAMVGMPKLSPVLREAIHSIGVVGELAGAGLLVAALITARRHRRPALVELHPASAGPPTVASITALHRDASGASAWIVAERRMAPPVLRTAAELGVRCFALEQQRFRELTEPS